MNRQQAALKLVLEALELPTNVTEGFEQRLILQKAIYLAQEKGVGLGYHYSWYLHGPYCRDLTSDAFATKDQDVSNYELDEGSVCKIAELKAFLEPLKGNVSSLARWLEIRASALFAVKTRQAEKCNAESIHAALIRGGKDVTIDEVKSAVGDLSRMYGWA